MDIGMLWFDNDPKQDLKSKVHKAAQYYKEKYGQEANLCFVHPSMTPDEKTDAGAVVVFSNSTVQPHHFWIGVHYQDVSNP